MLFELFDQLLTIAVKVVYLGIGNSKINKNAPLHFQVLLVLLLQFKSMSYIH